MEKNKMAVVPLKKLFLKMGLPMIISMVLQALYNVIDSIFITNMGSDGVIANQALTLAFPIQLLIIAIGVGTGVGINALLSKSLGEQNKDKVNKIVKTIYGGDGVIFTDKAKKQIKQLADWGLDRLPVCMAKTQYSLSDNPALLGAPTGFTITVSDIRVANGAGFIVCRTGDVMVMPGLPKRPAALNMDIEADGTIKGLF